MDQLTDFNFGNAQHATSVAGIQAATIGGRAPLSPKAEQNEVRK
jgi:hypothetical protein